MMNITIEMVRPTVAQICPFPIEIDVADDWDYYDDEIERWENDGGRSFYDYHK